MKHRRIAVFALVSLILVSSCVTTAPGQSPLTPLQRAELAYFDAGLGFHAVQEAAKIAAANGQISPQRAREFDSFQRSVNAADATVYPLLMTWKMTGQQPATWDAQLQTLLNAIANATAQAPKPVQPTNGGK